jgi:hypothetical protein
MVAPRAPSHYVRRHDGQVLQKEQATRRMTMKKHYEGLPAARNIQESIAQAQLQIVKDLDRRKQSAAAVQLLIDSVIDSMTCTAA